MSTEIKLMPCSKCGKDDSFEWLQSASLEWAMHCTRCFKIGQFKSGKFDAITAWNEQESGPAEPSPTAAPNHSIEDKLNARIEALCQDSAETHHNIAEIVKPILGQEAIDGDSYSVPSTEDLTEMVIEALQHEARLREGTLRTRIKELTAENDTLRGIATKVMPCHYCGVDDIAKCPRGFPGCALVDDQNCAEESLVQWLLEARERIKELEEALIRIEELTIPKEAPYCEVFEKALRIARKALGK